ncbi:MAG: hypothetical protein PHW64_02000 [Sulfuricurvum sp.]|nr:hypothetical protein [Sulfuricurvum sp.]
MTLVRIHDDIISIIDVKYEKKRYRFSAQKSYTDITLAALALKKKKAIRLLFPTEDIVEESITLPSVVKNEHTLRNALLVKLNDERHISEKLLLNKLHTSLDATQESATHQFEGLYEKEVLSALEPVAHLENVTHITAERYALLALAEFAFQNQSYLCVFTQEKNNLIVAVDRGVLLFSRIGILQEEDEVERVMEQIHDINRTVAYAHQQYREAKFSFIAICGTIADGEMAPIQLHAMTGLNVTVLAPGLFVKGVDNATAQKFILEIGMLYLNPSMNFIPDTVKASRQFYLGSMIAASVALVFFLLSLYQSIDEYRNYSDILEQYDTVQNDLMQTLRHTTSLPDPQLRALRAQLESSTSLQHHVIDDILPFEPLWALHKPANLHFDERGGAGILTMDFKKECKTLLELYQFEKEFKRLLAKVTLEVPTLQATYKTNYESLSFESSLALGDANTTVSAEGSQ